MVFSHIDFEGFDPDVVRRVIASARRIAPCIDSLEVGSDGWETAVAILRSVAADMEGSGGGRIASQRVGSASIAYRDVPRWSSEDIADLRALCGASAPSGLPRGAFPAAGIVGRLWPE